MQQTLVLCKPDAVQRQRVGRIIARFEDKGLKIAAMKLLQVNMDLAKRMYAVHKGKAFYEGLLRFITAGPVVAMVLEGVDVIHVVRSMMGETFGPDAAPGTIRGDFGVSRRYNLVHGSDSPEAAAVEIPLYFTPNEIVNYTLDNQSWSYDTIGPKPV